MRPGPGRGLRPLRPFLEDAKAAFGLRQTALLLAQVASFLFIRGPTKTYAYLRDERRARKPTDTCSLDFRPHFLELAPTIHIPEPGPAPP